MKLKTFLSLATLFFAIATVFHIIRLIKGMEVQFGNVTIPMAVSWFAAIIGGYLAYSGYKLQSGK